jgi:hypothetical protein
MPSVPQSLLWISLVVLWLFVLVPMLISKRDAVRRTSDVALATRVLNSGARVRKLKRGAPAAGHRSDPDWQPQEDLDDELDDEAHHEEPAPKSPAPKSVVLAAIDDSADTEPNYIDVDVIEDSGALPVGRSRVAEEPVEAAAQEPAERVVSAVPNIDDAHRMDKASGVDEAGEADPDEARELAEEITGELALELAEDTAGEDIVDEDGVDEDGVDEDGVHEDTVDEDSADTGSADEYEYVEDTSGLESSDEPPATLSPSAMRRRRYDAQTAAAVSARKYKFRKRVLMVMALALVLLGVAAYTIWPAGRWACVAMGAVIVIYLAYLRRQTRIEERLRRRRLARMARSRVGVENTNDRAFDLVPSRLRRPGSVVLEIDDEDPVFEHLDYVAGPVGYHLPKAAGQ